MSIGIRMDVDVGQMPLPIADNHAREPNRWRDDAVPAHLLINVMIVVLSCCRCPHRPGDVPGATLARIWGASS
jgi:hypothetical protein